MVRIFSVGGSVRDHLLGVEPKDRDYVVTGANPEWMISKGFKQVGAAFPVFLHPVTGEEYALARKEKKVSPGYNGFTCEFGPEVTLHEDLMRRDITINAIAMDPFTKEIIDPYGGCKDLANGIIRHTSEAFAEDPLRVLRVARFATRYGFKVADETIDLCKKIVQSNELDSLSPERIWIEFVKILNEKNPRKAFEFLDQVGALDHTKIRALVAYKPFETVSDKLVVNLSFYEKAYFFLDVHEMSNKELLDFRVQSDVTNQVKLIHSFNKVFDRLVSCYVNKAGKFTHDDVNMLIEFYDSRRNLLVDLSVIKFAQTILDNSDLPEKDVILISKVLQKIKIVIKTLQNLKFGSLTQGMKNGEEIKKLVYDTKAKAILSEIEKD